MRVFPVFTFTRMWEGEEKFNRAPNKTTPNVKCNEFSIAYREIFRFETPRALRYCSCRINFREWIVDTFANIILLSG